MKTFLLTIGLIFSMSVMADIEHVPGDDAKPTSQEVSSNRACFQELTTLGCGDPGEDPKHFRSCLNDVHHTLSVNCKKMMTTLYGIK